ncbi:hypothetical protein BaRGS_00017043, partial [Batillaria attramentaria]
LKCYTTQEAYVVALHPAEDGRIYVLYAEENKGKRLHFLSVYSSGSELPVVTDITDVENKHMQPHTQSDSTEECVSTSPGCTSSNFESASDNDARRQSLLSFQGGYDEEEQQTSKAYADQATTSGSHVHPRGATSAEQQHPTSVVRHHGNQRRAVKSLQEQIRDHPTFRKMNQGNTVGESKLDLRRSVSGRLLTEAMTQFDDSGAPEELSKSPALPPGPKSFSLQTRAPAASQNQSGRNKMRPVSEFSEQSDEPASKPGPTDELKKKVEARRKKLEFLEESSRGQLILGQDGSQSLFQTLPRPPQSFSSEAVSSHSFEPSQELSTAQQFSPQRRASQAGDYSLLYAEGLHDSQRRWGVSQPDLRGSFATQPHRKPPKPAPKPQMPLKR